VVIRYDGTDPTIGGGLTYTGPTPVTGGKAIVFTAGTGTINW